MSRRGRPPRRTPRHQRTVYMTDATAHKIDTWRQAQSFDYNVSDAVEKLVDAAVDQYRSAKTTKMRSATQLTESFPAWVEVDALNGRKLRCQRCGERYSVLATRFDETFREISSFCQTHAWCEKE